MTQVYIIWHVIPDCVGCTPVLPCALQVSYLCMTGATHQTSNTQCHVVHMWHVQLYFIVTVHCSMWSSIALYPLLSIVLHYSIVLHDCPLFYVTVHCSMWSSIALYPLLSIVLHYSIVLHDCPLFYVTVHCSLWLSIVLHDSVAPCSFSSVRCFLWMSIVLCILFYVIVHCSLWLSIALCYCQLLYVHCCLPLFYVTVHCSRWLSIVLRYTHCSLTIIGICECPLLHSV